MATGHLNRDRIRDYLLSQGPVEDAAGRTTAILRAAVDYNGSDVGFSQLLFAMERKGEIRREIRSKRTYRISAVASPARTKPAESGRVDERRHVQALPADASEQLRPSADAASLAGVDYDALAAALLARAVQVLSAGKPSDAGVAALREELERVIAERDHLRSTVLELETRLVRADRNTTALLQMLDPRLSKQAANAGEGRITDQAANSQPAGKDLVEIVLSALD